MYTVYSILIHICAVSICVRVYSVDMFLCVDKDNCVCVSIYQGIYTSTVQYKTVMINDPLGHGRLWGPCMDPWSFPTGRCPRGLSISRIAGMDGSRDDHKSHTRSSRWWSSMASVLPMIHHQVVCLKNVHDSYQLESVWDPHLETALIKEFAPSNGLALWVSKCLVAAGAGDGAGAACCCFHLMFPCMFPRISPCSLL